MRNEKREMKTNRKTCFDCLYCKVSGLSTQKCCLCFCSEKKKRIIHQDVYWLKKAVCQKFNSMGGA
jgi:hypothetical protein